MGQERKSHAREKLATLPWGGETPPQESSAHVGKYDGLCKGWKLRLWALRARGKVRRSLSENRTAISLEASENRTAGPLAEARPKNGHTCSTNFVARGALWLFVRKADEALHCIDLKSRQPQEYFDLKSRYSGYDLKSHSRPLASILHQGESFLPHVRQKAEQRKSACISASACCGGPCQKPSSSWNTVVRSILHPGRENTSASVSFWLYTALVV